jgi:nucleotide-binding universal stress UspA family protein
MYSTILLALDGSPYAELAIPHAVNLAKTFGSKIVLIRAVSVVIPTAPMDEAPMAYSEVIDAENEVAEEYIKAKIEEIKAQGFDVDGEHVLGNASSAILDSAEKWNADLIVMATHGRSGVARLVLGSVAESVVHHSRTPVLLVRVNEE